MEMRIGLQAFIDAFGDYTIDLDAVVWNRSLALRGPRRLPIRPGGVHIVAGGGSLAHNQVIAGACMRIAIVGGTRFIGAALVEDLVNHDHEVAVIHRGTTEAEGLPDVTHVHIDRHDVAAMRRAVTDHCPDALVDTCAYTRADARDLVAALPDDLAVVVLSSMDVYRAFHTLRTDGEPLDAQPMDEDAPVRTGDERYLFRGESRDDLDTDMDDYENLDVEEVVLDRGATVLRLPMVYGERNPMVREGHVLRRVLAGRRRIPIGSGTLLWTKGYVRDVAAAIRLAIELGGAPGDAVTIGERQTMSMRQWTRAILDATGHDAELVSVPDDALPDDMVMTKSFTQHVLVRSDRARKLWGWQDRDPHDALATSVAWHLQRLDAADFDPAQDDAALARLETNPDTQSA